jgi:uncharacterized protein (TIGR00369 family)
MTELPDDVLNEINKRLGGYNTAMALRFVRATLNELVAELEVTERHRQPYGLVHGGVYTGMIETVCSVGAALNVLAEGKSTVGLDNATSFLRVVRSGVLRCTARPLVRGRRTHVWEGEIHDDRDRLVATGRVRILVLETGAEADGVEVGIVPS